MWIEQRGQQHRFYWRTADGRRDYEAAADRAQAETFRQAAQLLGLDQARSVLRNPTHARAGGPPAPAAGSPAPAPTAPA